MLRTNTTTLRGHCYTRIMNLQCSVNLIWSLLSESSCWPYLFSNDRWIIIHEKWKFEIQAKGSTECLSRLFQRISKTTRMSNGGHFHRNMPSATISPSPSSRNKPPTKKLSRGSHFWTGLKVNWATQMSHRIVQSLFNWSLKKNYGANTLVYPSCKQWRSWAASFFGEPLQMSFGGQPYSHGLPGSPC